MIPAFFRQDNDVEVYIIDTYRKLYVSISFLEEEELAINEFFTG